MTIADAAFKDFAQPVEDSDVSREYWQTAKSVNEIAKKFGLASGKAVSAAVCKARLRGVVCCGCGEEIIVRDRTQALPIVNSHASGKLRRIRCGSCRSVSVRSSLGLPYPKRKSTPQEKSETKSKDGRAEFYLSWDWRTLRMKVLQQYGARCMCCGATPEHKTVGGEPVVIVVDHIKPLSKRWDLRLDRGNLQVLCQECNQGKGAWDETDYRPVPKTEGGEVLQ